MASHLKSDFGANISFRANGDSIVQRLIHVAGFHLDQSETNRMVDATRPPVDAWVLDVHGDAAHMVRKLRDEWPDAKLSGLDYFEYDSDCPDAIINLCNHNLNRDRPPEWVAYHEGPQYAIIRDEFKPYRRSRDCYEQPHNILVSFGSGDVGNSTQAVMEAAVVAGLPDTTYHVVIGPNALHRDSTLQTVRESPLDVRAHETPENLPELMASCDLAFCGGGTTMLELAFLGVPAICIAQTEHEERFAKLLETRGALACLGRADRCQPAGIAEALVAISSSADRLQSMHDGGQRLVDGEGISRITEVLMRTLSAG